MSNSRDPPPEDLLRLARRGVKHALGDLLEIYRPYLSLLARLQIGRRLQGKVDPADLIQETFLKAYAGFEQFRGTTEAELAGWLRQILTSNLALLVRRFLGTRRRDLRLERELSADVDESSRALERNLIAPDGTPSQQASRREQAVLLANALARLPAHYREVIILRHLEGLSFAVVAGRLGRSVNSVEKLWARALGRLREGLEGVG